MTDPFAAFRTECAALIKSRVPEPAGYVFEIPPKKEMGQLACNVAFQLPRLRKNAPLKIAQDIVAGMDRGRFRLVRDVQAAPPGFVNFYLDHAAYAQLVLDGIRADGDHYGRDRAAAARRPLVEHTSVNPNKAWHIGHTRNAVLGDTLGRLFRFCAAEAEIQNYIDDTGKQVADMIFGLRHFGCLADDGTLQVPPGRKLDHFVGEIYAQLYDLLSAEPALRAEQEALDEARRANLTSQQVTARLEEIDGALAALDPKRAPEREVEGLQRLQAGWQALAALHATDAADHEARSREIADRLDEIAALKAGAEEVQHTLERGDYRAIVHACLHAQLATAWRLGIFYDLLTWEQDIVRSHLLEEALTRIKESPAVYTVTEGRKKGCLVVEMGRLLPQGAAGTTGTVGTAEDDEHSTEVVLVRSNGLPTYVGKDVAYHFWKYGLLHNDMRYAEDTVQPDGRPLWTSSPHGGQRTHVPAGEVINLIDSRQSYPQQVVAAALKLTGHGDVGFHHLAYGVVSARIGGEDISMSGRFGNGIPADDVLDQAAAFALERIREKHEAALSEEEMQATAERIAAAAMRYVMVRYNPLTDIVLDPAEIVEFEGNTGAYLLYAYTRIAAILRRAEERRLGPEQWQGGDAALLGDPAEADLIGVLGRLPDTIRTTAETLAVNLLAEFAYELATAFSQFYNRCPILNAQPPLEPALLHARLGVVAATAQVMRNLYGILGLELVERL